MPSDFLKELPCRSKANFSMGYMRNDITPRVVVDVPVKDCEQTIIQDKKPFIIQCLEANFNVRKEEDDKQEGSSRGTKRESNDSRGDNKNRKLSKDE